LLNIRPRVGHTQGPLNGLLLAAAETGYATGVLAGRATGLAAGAATGVEATTGLLCRSGATVTPLLRAADRTRRRCPL